jgi:hypothetical protein
MIGRGGELQYLRQRNAENLGGNANSLLANFLQIAFIESERAKSCDRVLLGKAPFQLVLVSKAFLHIAADPDQITGTVSTISDSAGVNRSGCKKGRQQGGPYA